MVRVGGNVVCSSYAHTLGVYSVPFEDINFDLGLAAWKLPAAEVKAHEAPNVVQGNIITTKGERQKAGQGKINPMLVDNASRDLDQSATIIPTGAEAQLNLDMNAFLGQTKTTKGELDIINEVLAGCHLVDEARPH